MRLTLERAELIQLIGNSLGYTIADDDVTVKADPFEVRIKNVDLSGMAQSKTSVSKDMDNILEDEEEEMYTGEEDAADSILTMADILNKNQEIGGAGAPTDRAVGDIPRRPLGPLETEEPPIITEEELNAAIRTARQ